MVVLKSISFIHQDRMLEVMETQDGEIAITIGHSDPGTITVDYQDFFEIVELLNKFVEDIKPDEEEE